MPKLAMSESALCGNSTTFLEARHLRLAGTQEDIGRALAQITAERFQIEPRRADDPVLGRARRQWFARHWPAQYARMRGAAAAFGLPVEDERYDLGELFYLAEPIGCSVLWCPPATTADGAPVLSRNYDFPRVSFSEFVGAPIPGQLPAMSRPFVLDIRPHDGPATLCITTNDLLSSAMEGVNDYGLTVALLADDDVPVIERSLTSQVGLNEIQLVRFLLDTCKTVDEARAALLQAKHYYALNPCHYLIGDASGRHFVWERPGSNREVALAGDDGTVRIVANHLLCQRRNGAPDTDSHVRTRALSAALASVEGRMTIDDLGRVHACARVDRGDDSRTLWHAFYFPRDRRARVSFYVDDDQTGRGRYSPYIELALDR